MPGSHANTAQCLPGHTPFSMLIVPPDSFCAGGREKKKRPPPSLPSLPPLPYPPSPQILLSPRSPCLPSPIYCPPHRSSFSPPGLRHHWSRQNTHSTGIKVKGCSCLNKERGGEGAEDGGRTGWEGVTHRLSPLFRQRAERGLQRRGVPLAGRRVTVAWMVLSEFCDGGCLYLFLSLFTLFGPQQM